MKKIKDGNVDHGRRTFLKASAAAGVMAYGMPLSQLVWAQEGKVLKVRSYADINKLDPGFYQNAYNVDVMNCIYSKLISYTPGSDWDTELQAAESIEQVDPIHIRFKLRPGIMFTGSGATLNGPAPLPASTKSEFCPLTTSTRRRPPIALETLTLPTSV